MVLIKLIFVIYFCFEAHFLPQKFSNDTHLPFTSVSHSKLGPHAEGVVGFASPTTIGYLDGKLGQMTLAINPSSVVPIINTTPTTAQTSKVNTIQTNSSKKPRGKNKNKGKSKKASSKKGGEKTQQLIAKGNKNKFKFKYPCMVCKEDNLTKEFPCFVKVRQYLKQGSSSSQLVILTNIFPPQHQQMVSQNLESIQVTHHKRFLY